MNQFDDIDNISLIAETEEIQLIRSKQYNDNEDDEKMRDICNVKDILNIYDNNNNKEFEKRESLLSIIKEKKRRLKKKPLRFMYSKHG